MRENKAHEWSTHVESWEKKKKEKEFTQLDRSFFGPFGTIVYYNLYVSLIFSG